jgi:dihydrofolate synthase / folylpolyglutamate synthase
MRFSSYPTALAWLYARNQFAMKMGLEKTQELLQAVGNPEACGVYLHVAGTNGKGSVCVALARMLPTLGVKRVGLYTSPHLVSFRERIRVDGAPVPAAFVTEWLNRHIETLEALNPTYFEIVTAMAFAWFRECGCEAVVLETGLGGRLDATNVVMPRVTVITSISLDHMAMLGDTVEAIQREKLGIVKPGVPLIVDEGRAPLAAAAEATAAAAGASLLNLDDRLNLAGNNAATPAFSAASLRGRYRTYELPSDLRAHDYEWRNAALAVLALEAFHGAALPPEAVWVPALRAARMPGRLQHLVPRTARAHLPVLLDAAHNPAGMEALARVLEETSGDESQKPASSARVRRRVFFSVMADKDFGTLFTSLCALSSDLVFVDLSATNPRALTAAGLENLLPVSRASELIPSQRVTTPPNIRVITPTTEELEPLLRAESGADRAVFCGSLFLLGAVIPLLEPLYEGLEEFTGMTEE